MSKDSYSKIFKDVKKVMCVFSHPDDLEIYAGGTVSRLLEDEIEVMSIKMTLGNKGSRQEKISEKELTKTRLAEDKKAMQVLNIKVENNIYLNTALSAIDAAYPYSRDLLFFPEHFKNAELSTHACTKFLLVDYYNHEDTIWIDMTEFANTRTKAIASHSSQYSLVDAQDSTDFFTKLDKSRKQYERFRYVLTD